MTPDGIDFSFVFSAGESAQAESADATNTIQVGQSSQKVDSSVSQQHVLNFELQLYKLRNCHYVLDIQVHLLKSAAKST